MSFRDDHEAAIARVDALEAEVVSLKRDVARLEAENAALRDPPRPRKPKAPRPQKRDRPASERRKRALQLAGGAGIGALFVVMVGAPAYLDCNNDREFKSELASFERAKASWSSLVLFEECARDTLRDIERLAAIDAASADPRRQAGHHRVSMVTDCAKNLAPLGDIPHLVAAKSLLDDWRAKHAALVGPNQELAAYYSNRDWKDDDYAGAPRLWADFTPALQAYARTTQVAFRATAPLARAEIRARQRAHEDKRGKDAVWWRIEVGYLRNELASLVPLGGTQAEMLEKARQMRAVIASAPIELRRDWRQLVDELDWVDRGQKDPRELTDYPLWRGTSEEGKGPIPKRPVRKEGC